MKIEEMQSSLEARELIMSERSSERSIQQALQVQTVKKDEYDKKNFKKGKSNSKGETGQILKRRTKPVIKLNLQKEEVMVIIKARRKALIRRRYVVIIVKSLVIMLLNVGLVNGSK